MRRILLGVALSIIVVAPARADDMPGGGVSAEALSRHVRVLASDAYEGRAPATPGEDRTIEYLVAEFKKAGVQPAGDGGSPEQGQ